MPSSSHLIDDRDNTYTHICVENLDDDICVENLDDYIRISVISTKW